MLDTDQTLEQSGRPMVVTEAELLQSQEAKAIIRSIFPDRSFLYHGTSATNLPGILELGGLAARGHLTGEKNPPKSDSGLHGISFNLDRVVVSPGVADMVCGFLTSPDAALQPWLKLSTTYFSAENEVQLLDADTDVAKYAASQASAVFWEDLTHVTADNLSSSFTDQPSDLDDILHDFKTADIDYFESLFTAEATEQSDQGEDTPGQSHHYRISPDYTEAEVSYPSIYAYLALKQQSLLDGRQLNQFTAHEITEAIRNTSISPAFQYLHFTEELSQYSPDVAVDLQNLILIAPETMQDEIAGMLSAAKHRPRLVILFAPERDIKTPSTWFSGSGDADKIQALIESVLNTAEVPSGESIQISQLVNPDEDYVKSSKQVKHLKGSLFKDRLVRSVIKTGDELKIVDDQETLAA